MTIGSRRQSARRRAVFLKIGDFTQRGRLYRVDSIYEMASSGE